MQLHGTALGMSVAEAIRVSSKPARVFAALGMFWGSFAAFVPQLKANIGVGDAVFGTILLCTSIGLATAMVAAPLLDQKLGKFGMPVAVALLAVTFLVPGTVSQPLYFAVAMLFVGAASGLLDVTMNARVADLESHHSRPLMNANHAMFSLGYGLAAIATGFAREAGVPPVIMFLCLGIVAVPVGISARMPPAPDADPSAPKGRLPLVPIVFCGALVLIAFMSEAAVEAWSALHLERTLGGRAAEGAMGPAMLGMTMAAGRLVGQWATERFDTFAVIAFSGVLGVFGAVIAASAPTTEVAYFGFAAIGLGVSAIGPLGLAIAGQLVPARHRARAISVTAVIGFSGFFFAPFLMGLVSEFFGLRWAFASIALLFLGLPILLPLLRQRMRSRG